MESLSSRLKSPAATFKNARSAPLLVKRFLPKSQALSQVFQVPRQVNQAHPASAARQVRVFSRLASPRHHTTLTQGGGLDGTGLGR